MDPFKFGHWVSAEAAEQFRTDAYEPTVPDGDIESVRAHYDAFNERHLAVALDRYRVDIERADIAGVAVDWVCRPQSQSHRTLLCLHGGAFMWGRGAGALLEAVPVASVSGIRVGAVEYALAPERKFPDAVEDVLTVYRNLLERQDADTIGIYGCSAGGMLTAQVTARLIGEGLPLPGAIAMLCGTGMEIDGDSTRVASALSNRQDHVDEIRFGALPHLAGVDPADKILFPGEHPDILARFPQSLLITGTRDFAASSVSTMHRRLVAAGADASLFSFDGMWHAFHMATAMPESREVFALLSDFFAGRLR